MPRARKRPLFEIGNQWISSVPGSAQYYHFWTDAGTGRTSRASLRTTDLDEAKRRLAEIVISGAPKTINTPLAIVLRTYFEGRTDNLPSKDNARLAGRTLLACWGATVRVCELGEAKQKEFVEWSVAKGHSLGYVSRNLSVLAAALSHSKIKLAVTFKEPAIREKWAVKAKPRARRHTPSDHELARILTHAGEGNFFRWLVISLGTAARPEAAMEVCMAQRNRDAGTLSLNPEGRPQNRKYRATIREPRFLSAWLDHWATDRYCAYTTVESVQTAIERLRVKKEVAVPRFSAYSCRHKIATVLRQARIPKEERDLFMGHARPEGYGEWDPDYLKACADALDAWWIGLDKLVEGRSLFAPVCESENVKRLRA